MCSPKGDCFGLESQMSEIFTFKIHRKYFPLIPHLKAYSILSYTPEVQGLTSALWPDSSPCLLYLAHSQGKPLSRSSPTLFSSQHLSRGISIFPGPVLLWKASFKVEQYCWEWAACFSHKVTHCVIAPVTISQMHFGYYMQIPFMKWTYKAKLKSPVKTEVVIKMMLTEPTPILHSQPAKTSLTLKSIFFHHFIE